MLRLHFSLSFIVPLQPFKMTIKFYTLVNILIDKKRGNNRIFLIRFFLLRAKLNKIIHKEIVFT